MHNLLLGHVCGCQMKLTGLQVLVLPIGSLRASLNTADSDIIMGSRTRQDHGFLCCPHPRWASGENRGHKGSMSLLIRSGTLLCMFS